MEFKDKLRSLRKSKNRTQKMVSDKIDVSLRTYKNYELGHSRPRYREIYLKLSKIYDININYLLTEDEFLDKASEKYGKNGFLQAKHLVNQLGALFAGGELSEKDRDVVMRQMQEIYWDAKKENKKFTPKKYLKDENE
ncbi:MAG: helix-turn-helix transcriptional regulator [Peptoniphilaceae bacterium]|nr:helix-turn-helix domain-containing protein [Peptoniphilaceae bacterium]MDY3738615.1 helix-turn-helix transcriptional regulator [Peptoniphilaceae bacterium]